MDFSFQGANNKVYHLSPLTLGDLRRFKEWVQMRPYFLLLSLGLPKEVIDGESKRVLNDCLAKDITEGAPEVQQTMETSEGISQLVFLSVKRNHPGITLDEVEEVLCLSNLKEVSEKLMACFGLGGSVEKKTMMDTISM